MECRPLASEFRHLITSCHPLIGKLFVANFEDVMSSSHLAVENYRPLIGDTVSIADSDTGSIDAGHSTPCPTLCHSLKHDKSILSIAVSSKCLYAGTEGGAILVRGQLDLLKFHGLTRYRSSAWKHFSRQMLRQHIKGVSLVCSSRRVENYSSRQLPTDL